jgi:hypothetical protein
MSDARRGRWHPVDVNSEVAVTTSSGRKSQITKYFQIGISAMVSDHTDKN